MDADCESALILESAPFWRAVLGVRETPAAPEDGPATPWSPGLRLDHTRNLAGAPPHGTTAGYGG